MKTVWFILALTIFISTATMCVTHTITNSGFSFSPSTLTINLGDTVKFILGSTHNAREVDLATWNAGGTASNGGFETPFSGGTVLITQVGTHYYVCVPHASIGMNGQIVVNPSTDIQTTTVITPTAFYLKQNFPNPFNPSTIISFNLPKKNHVTLKIYNTIGNEIATLIDGDIQAGTHEIKWDAKTISAGVYFYRIETDEFIGIKKLTLLK